MWHSADQLAYDIINVSRERFKSSAFALLSRYFAHTCEIKTTVPLLS